MAEPEADPAAPPEPSTATDPGRFVELHQAGIWRYLRLLGAPPHEAEDLLQETFLAFLRRTVPAAAPTALLRRIARDLWVDRQRWLARRRAVERAAAVDEMLAATATDRELDGWLEALAACRDRLAPRSRLALELAYRDGLGRQRIAAELGVAGNTVRNLLAKTRHSLRECIDGRMQQWGLA